MTKKSLNYESDEPIAAKANNRRACGPILGFLRKATQIGRRKISAQRYRN
jgi:hypothetical protein